MKAKPIEPGCLALLVNIPWHKRDAKYLEGRDIVLVMGPAKSGEAGWWTIDVCNYEYQYPFVAIQERYLLRIDDDPSAQKQIESEKPVEVEYGN